MSILDEFKTFAVKGNVVDMGVGIVIGAAFTTIVGSFVDDLLNPILGVVTGGIDFSNYFVNLGAGDYSTLAAAQEAGAPTLNYGLFINAVINFLIVSFVLFLLIKQTNRLRHAAEQEPAAPDIPEPAADVMLLTEIRDLLAGGSRVEAQAAATSDPAES